MDNFLIYGANGYTGDLIAREAVKRGLRPILAGRNGPEVKSLAGELGLEHRIFSLDNPKTLDGVLGEICAVLHCAGPFAHTSKSMVDGCLRTGTHYLDVTGEIAVFEAIASRDVEANEKGVMLLPGVGFDVVPSDCLAAHLKTRLPSATHLTLAFSTRGGLSRGTATTLVENLHRGGMIREQGKLKRVPAAWKTQEIDFGNGPRKAITIPWGDVATAWYSTGIGNIQVYLAAPLGTRAAMRAARWLSWLVKTSTAQNFLKKRIRAQPPGPTDQQRAAGSTRLWGEVTDPTGKSAVSRLHGPEGYTFTAQAALTVVQHVLAGKAPVGFQTPSLAFGPNLVLEVPGVERTDE